MKKICFIINIFTLLLFTADLSAEIIRLKDGQVLNGEIIGRDERFITVKTRYQTRKIARYDLAAIEKEKTGLDRIYIFTRDNNVIAGFLVEQDSMRVEYKIKEDSPDTKTISKLDILQLSNEEIRPVDLEFTLKLCAFFPLNSGGAKLEPAPAVLAGAGFSSMFRRNLRFSLESGYVQSENSKTSERYLKAVPVTLSAAYRFTVPLGIEVTPKIGAGVSMFEFNDGEGDEFSSTVLAGTAGLQITYPVIPYKLHIGLFGDYLTFYDGSGFFNSAMSGFFVGLRFR